MDKERREPGRKVSPPSIVSSSSFNHTILRWSTVDTVLTRTQTPSIPSFRLPPFRPLARSPHHQPVIRSFHAIRPFSCKSPNFLIFDPRSFAITRPNKSSHRTHTQSFNTSRSRSEADLHVVVDAQLRTVTESIGG